MSERKKGGHLLDQFKRESRHLGTNGKGRGYPNVDGEADDVLESMSFKLRTSKYRHVFCDAPKQEVSRWTNDGSYSSDDDVIR